MTVFADRLRARIAALGLTHAEVARRTRLDPRRFGHYATGHREPDFRTLIRLSTTLATTPDALLGVMDQRIVNDPADRLRDQIAVACRGLDYPMLEIISAQIAAVVDLHHRHQSRKTEGPQRKGAVGGRRLGQPKSGA